MLLELLEASSNNISVVSSSIIVLNGFCGGWLAGLFCIFCVNVGAAVEKTCLLLFPSGLLCCCAGCEPRLSSFRLDCLWRHRSVLVLIFVFTKTQGLLKCAR